MKNIESRYQAILTRIERSWHVEMRVLARRFPVSPRTVRHDPRGPLDRMRGGARRVGQAAGHDHARRRWVNAALRGAPARPVARGANV